MMMKRMFILTALVVFVAASGVAGAADFKYVGVKTCKMCHNKPDNGAQYSQWMATGHAKAFASLASPEAKAKAKEMGIEDPQKDAKCLKCHVTGFAAMADTTQKVVAADGVTCESCHGAGSGYKTKKVMESVHAGTTERASVGLVKPDKNTCLNCHVAEGNPFYKEFKYEEAVKKIVHPNPAAKKSE